jgi:hypothetical protein
MNLPKEPVAPEMVCEICGYGLEQYEQWAGGKLQSSEYSHGYLPPGIPPHQPVPRPRPGNHADVMGVCDFCTEPDPAWIYPCESYHTMLGTKFEIDGWKSESYGSVGDWGACDTCHNMIETGNWDAMVERNLKAQPERQVEPAKSFLKKAIREMWRGFEANRTGPAYREAEGR